MFVFTNKPQGRALDAKLGFRRNEEHYRSVRKLPGGLHILF